MADGLGGPVALVADSTEFAGAERYAIELVAALQGRCEFVAIVGEDSAEETRLRLGEAGARVETVPGLRRRPSLGAVRALTRTLRSIAPALVHLNLTDQGDGLGTLLAARRSGRPYLATLHLVLPKRRRWREAVSRRALRGACVIGVSEAVGGYLRQRGIPTVVVRNGLSPPRPAPNSRAALGVAETDFVVGGIGRLDEQKGWDVLCRAAPLVREQLPGAVLVVIGEGAERERLERLPECREVRFVGYRRDAASLLDGFDVLVVPSRYEGLGLTPLEAMYLGVPVIASDVPGLAEALGDAGIMVPPEEPEALADAVLKVASDRELRDRLTEQGRKRVQEKFSVERMATETLAVYQSMLASATSDSREARLAPDAGRPSPREGAR